MFDFFDPQHQTPITEKQFGLKDTDEGAVVVDVQDGLKEATVNNHSLRKIIITKIDKGVIDDNTSCCDVMLTTDKHLYFIELKTRKKGTTWKKKGIDQLIETVKLFNASHPELKDRHQDKKAYVCNRKDPKPIVGTINQRKLLEFSNLGFQLNIQAIVCLG